MEPQSKYQLRDLLAWHSQFVAVAQSVPQFARRNPSIQLAILDISAAVEEIREDLEDALKAAEGGKVETVGPNHLPSVAPASTHGPGERIDSML